MQNILKPFLDKNNPKQSIVNCVQNATLPNFLYVIPLLQLMLIRSNVEGHNIYLCNIFGNHVLTVFRQKQPKRAICDFARNPTLPNFLYVIPLLQLMLKVMTCRGIALQNKSESTVYVVLLCRYVEE